ncbi:hypothetical protein CSC70_08370 [Pseudoxanthomonas kalamensis DSM 18571]|uniref:hypothetical protein n=1 Tax=Pseudoxanthomonas kalamensis TaxID=289483 RepID=UPI00139146EF|nr:hypothetical protein [Pseudoxanthomonas kalamensis]KAF1710654.1 hypothetical protein CSC70_08370 [Pseudoxanthomonas kalamensis DSM 18571]
MSKIFALRSRLSLQPTYLKLATVACIVVGAAISLAPFFPGTHFTIGETSLSQGAIWSTGTFIALFTAGPLTFLAGAGLLLTKGWARPLLIVLPLPQALPFHLVHWFLAGPDPSWPAPISVTVILFIFWAAFWYLYLYRYAGALEYFADAP